MLVESSTRGTKNDAKDSFLIAQVTRFNGYSNTTLPDEVMISLKLLTFLIDYISDYKRKATVVLNKIFSDIFRKTSKEVLTKYPFPKYILNENLESLTKVLSSSSKGRFGYSKAEQLQSQISELDEKIAVLLRSLDTTIETIPGIGPILGAIIVSEIGDINPI